MVVYNIIPGKSVNGIKFGMPRQLIKNNFKITKEFKKAPTSKNTTDVGEHCHFFYTDSNLFYGIEIFIEDEVVVTLNNQEIPKMVNMYRKFIQQRDPGFTENEYGIYSKKLHLRSRVNEDGLKSIFFHK